MINNIIDKPYLIMRIRPKDPEVGHKLSTSSIIINNLNTVTSNRSLNHLRTIFLFENKVSMGSHRPRSPRTKMLRPRRCRPIMRQSVSKSSAENTRYAIELVTNAKR